MKVSIEDTARRHQEHKMKCPNCGKRSCGEIRACLDCDIDAGTYCCLYHDRCGHCNDVLDLQRKSWAMDEEWDWEWDLWM